MPKEGTASLGDKPNIKADICVVYGHEFDKIIDKCSSVRQKAFGHFLN